MKILWLSPNLNHYKAEFLNIFAKKENIDLTVLAGTGRKNMGDEDSQIKMFYKLLHIDVNKAKFGFSKKIRDKLKDEFAKFDWIMLPREKKNFLLFVYAMYLRKKSSSEGKKVRLISYNHPILSSANGKGSFLDKLLTKFYYNFYDRIIFYTEESYIDMINTEYINSKKAYWANNTINTEEVKKYYTFTYPNPNEPTIVFIGRLIQSKKIELLIEYYYDLKQRFKKRHKTLKLIIIGDGPENHIVKKAKKNDSTIEWPGALISEQEIAPYMKRASMVFIPGHSGLSVNHAFCYGRPYFTIASQSHAPEINYLKHGKNGFILKKNKSDNIRTMFSFMDNFNKEYYENAYMSGEDLSINNWCNKMEEAFFAD